VHSLVRLSIIFLLFTLLCLCARAQDNNLHKKENGASETPAGSAGPGSSDKFWIDKIEPVEAARGEQVTVTGTFSPKPVAIKVQLRRVDGVGQAGSYSSSGKWKEDGKSFVFLVPQDALLGQYEIASFFSDGDNQIAPLYVPNSQEGSFRIVINQPVKVTAIYPEVNYPQQENFSFKVIGEGFSYLKEDNALVIEGRGIIPLCSEQNKESDCVYEKIIDYGHEIEFSGLPSNKYYGPLKMLLRVGDRYSEKPVAVTLSSVNRYMSLLVAVALSALLTCLVFLILKSKRWGQIAGKHYSRLSAIFLDKETNTYSLSKFQFYAWTVAALFIYIYLTVTRSLGQRKFDFPDTPGNLSEIILISAFTWALAVGITSVKGAKGAGEIGPSVSDFITTGGLVAAERLQFFMWTVVGVIAFLLLYIQSGVATTQDSAIIPEGFLYLMGVASFGYLAGKLVRKPGPRITQIEARASSLTLEIHGQSLSPDATFEIDKTHISPGFLNKDENQNGRPQVIVQDKRPDFAKVMRLVITEPDEKWLKGEHKLTVTNPDGQKAVWPFTVAAPPAHRETKPDAPAINNSTTATGAVAPDAGPTNIT